jgi:hypothetical protein
MGGNRSSPDGENAPQEAAKHRSAGRCEQYAGLLLLSGGSKVHKTQRMFKELAVLQKVTSLS